MTEETMSIGERYKYLRKMQKRYFQADRKTRSPLLTEERGREDENATDTHQQSGRRSWMAPSRFPLAGLCLRANISAFLKMGERACQSKFSRKPRMRAMLASQVGCPS